MPPARVVVVDLPLVPVIAISVLDTKRDASSISPVIATPAARAAASSGISGTPGDRTISSAPVKVSRLWPPSSRVTSAGSALSVGPSASAPRLAVTHTRAARRAQLGGRDPGTPETDHEHAFTVQIQVQALISP